MHITGYLHDALTRLAKAELDESINAMYIQKKNKNNRDELRKFLQRKK